jgi:CspA family cold shock protein
MSMIKPAVRTEQAGTQESRFSTSELRAMQKELGELAALSPADIVARLDIDAAARRFRSVLLEAEKECAFEAPEVEEAVVRYETFCRTWADGSGYAAPTAPVRDAGLVPELEVFEIGGAIKWFDVSKGYGFIVPDNGLADVLLHVTCLRAGGYQTALQGARVRCEVLRRRLGMQAFRILEMDQSTGIHPSLLPQRTHALIKPESGWERATVKWFNRVRGFGYLAAGDENSDIFVHMETLRRFGFTELRPGQEVEVRWGQGSKGRMAAELRPLSVANRAWLEH